MCNIDWLRFATCLQRVATGVLAMEPTRRSVSPLKRSLYWEVSMSRTKRL